MVDIMKTDDPEAIARGFAKFANVAEPWVMHDSILICSAFYGTESRIPGWFTTFAAFAAREEHVFFKNRTAANAGLQYCNLKTQDSLDFVFQVYSWGLSFWAPASNQQTTLAQPNGEDMAFFDSETYHIWETELVRHCGCQFKTQQDIRIEAAACLIPDGMGAIGNAVGHEAAIAAQDPMLHWIGTTGSPELKNRWNFKNPINLPRTATIEGTLKLSNYGRYLGNLLRGPHHIELPSNSGTRLEFDSRCGVTMSLVGKRLVQQRGEYHV